MADRITDERLREIAENLWDIWLSDLTKEVCAELLAARKQIDLLEGGLRSLRLHCEAHGLEETANNLKRYGLWVDVSDVGRYQ